MKIFEILSKLSTIIGMVKAVEEAVPLPGVGKAKLDAVLAMLTVALGDISAILPQVTSIIAAIVAMLNTTGWKKSVGDSNAILN